MATDPDVSVVRMRAELNRLRLVISSIKQISDDYAVNSYERLAMISKRCQDGLNDHGVRAVWDLKDGWDDAKTSG